MALTWSLVATISREADNSLIQKLGGFVSGDTVVVYMVRSGSTELWRSNDRGVTWAFHTVTGASSSTDNAGPTLFDSAYWISDSSNSLTIRTPSANPGAGGFTSEAMGFAGGRPAATESSPFLYIPDTSAGGSPPAAIHRRTGVGAYTTLEIASGDVWDAAIQIPGTADLLIYAGGGAPSSLHRITPSGSPVTIVNTLSVTNGVHTAAPVPAAIALTSTDYWASGAGTDPTIATIHRTTNGGTSWTTTNPTTGFWEAFAAGGREAHATGFRRFGGNDYSLFIYKNTVSGDHLKHVKVAKFNIDTLTWDAESNDTNDGFRVIHALNGTNAAGDLDFYAVTYDAASDTAKVYRTTLAAAAPLVPATPVALGLEIAPPRFNPIRENYPPVVRIY